MATQNGWLIFMVFLLLIATGLFALGHIIYKLVILGVTCL